MNNDALSSSRCSPISHLVGAKPQAESRTQALSHPVDLIKVGGKGPGLAQWAKANHVPLPEKLYDVARVGERGLIVRVGNQEFVLECPQSEPLLAQIDSALRPSNGIYRIEQQSVSIDLTGPRALPALNQTCGVDMAHEPANRVVYSRVAGVSCGIIPLDQNGQRSYRIWVDPSLAAYLWETLVEIVEEH